MNIIKNKYWEKAICALNEYKNLHPTKKIIYMHEKIIIDTDDDIYEKERLLFNSDIISELLNKTSLEFEISEDYVLIKQNSEINLFHFLLYECAIFSVPLKCTSFNFDGALLFLNGYVCDIMIAICRIYDFFKKQ